jgi:hypothetical protein
MQREAAAVRQGGRPEVGATHILQCRERQLLSGREEGQRWEQLTSCNAERGGWCQGGRKARGGSNSHTVMQREAGAVREGGRPEVGATHIL